MGCLSYESKLISHIGQHRLLVQLTKNDAKKREKGKKAPKSIPSVLIFGSGQDPPRGARFQALGFWVFAYLGLFWDLEHFERDFEDYYVVGRRNVSSYLRMSPVGRGSGADFETSLVPLLTRMTISKRSQCNRNRTPAFIAIGFAPFYSLLEKKKKVPAIISNRGIFQEWVMWVMDLL